MSGDEAPDVDVSLIEAALAMTVKERLQQNDRMVRMALRLREAFGLAERGGDEPPE